MQTNELKIYKRAVALEFIKYVFVGGLAFLVASGIMIFFREIVFLADASRITLLISVAIGFLAGLVFNFFLSHLLVFNSRQQRARGNNLKGFVIYSLIGLIGLALTEAGMLAGVALVGHVGFRYVLVKCFVAGLVLIWNYAARKIFVYKGE
ncbi:MAG: GtrA family protein [Anaerolineaceae bacterium]|nr:GtrA family protein [Anaerolineaceae bacterium]